MEKTENEFFHRTWVQIDLNRVRENYSVVRAATDKDIYAVVKADAYGHGETRLAVELEKMGAAGFAVSNLLEAEQLRQAGIKSPVLILGYTPEQYADRLAAGKITQCVHCAQYAEKLNAAAEQAGVTVKAHLKLDTGMGRVGFDFRTAQQRDLENAQRTLKLQNIDFEGVFMHFSVADSTESADIAYTAMQCRRFWDAVDLLEREHPFRLHHCCNSAAALDLKEEKGDLLRVGILLYGLAPSQSVRLPENLKPVMSMYSVISQVKTVEEGQAISYGRTYVTQTPRRIATVTAGYADGIPRLLSNGGSVLIRGQRAAVVGRICMDQFCVDVTDIPQAAMGDTVTIFGPGLPVEELAELAQTVNYEIVCGISKRVPRVYVETENPL